MRTARRVLALGLLTLVLGIAAGGALVWWALTTLERPYGEDGHEVLLTVPPGERATRILERLESAGVLANATLARLYLVHVLDDPPLKAGEYRFVLPLSTAQALDKLIRGEVITLRVTLIEGLTLDESAAALAEAGFGERERFSEAMSRPDPISDLDPAATDLEGYLFPDTYAFARGTSESAIVATLVETFRRRVAELEPRLGPEPDMRRLVTLASIVEKEALLDEERPVIAGVYTNRLDRGMALGADPTVIYALKRRAEWDGNLRRPHLKLDSPFNTYVNAGLPPGPICSPGLASLVAAADPAEVPYLYFVSRNDGSHVFARTLSEHNRNVERWQRQYWRERWAQERRQTAGGDRPD